MSCTATSKIFQGRAADGFQHIGRRVGKQFYLLPLHHPDPHESNISYGHVFGFTTGLRTPSKLNSGKQANRAGWLPTRGSLARINGAQNVQRRFGRIFA